MPPRDTEQRPALFFKRTATPMHFPDVRASDFGDIVAVGGSLHPANLLAAYRRGIFPWPIEGWPLTWFCPRERAVLDFRDLHVPRSLARERRRTPLRFSVDADFAGVVRGCALAPRPEQEGTWITREIYENYSALHRAGHAHSVEAWEGGALGRAEPGERPAVDGPGEDAAAVGREQVGGVEAAADGDDVPEVRAANLGELHRRGRPLEEQRGPLFAVAR